MNYQNIDILGDDEEIILPENATFIITHTYLPYSYWQIVRILHDVYGAHLVLVRGYKEGRYVYHYKQHYKIVDDITGEIIFDYVHLDDLRAVFAKNGIPLMNQEEDEPLYDSKGRNLKAQAFLDTVKLRSSMEVQ